MENNSTSPAPLHTKEFMGHPIGLGFLFITELWERFSYYGMRSILILYLVAEVANGGFGWSDYDALELYGLYTMSVFMATLPGGFIADKFMGQRKAVVLGGIFIAAGQFLMVHQTTWSLYTALGLIVIGTGFLKSNISVMVGSLYKDGDSRRDSGFTIFYMGINIGAFLAPLICGYIAMEYGWKYAFTVAGFGMVVGQIIFMSVVKKVFGDVGKFIKPEKTEGPKEKKILTQEEVERVAVILTLSVFVIFFWAGFEQAGGYMNLYTDKFTDRMLGGFEVPTAWFQSLNPLFIIAFAPVLSILWTTLGKRGKNPNSALKMALGLILLGLGFVFMMGAVWEQGGDLTHKTSMMWLVAAYFLHTIGELCLSPIGLSAVTKLAPLKYAAMMMGVWFFATSISNYVAAKIGQLAADFGAMETFMGIAIAVILAGLVLFSINKKIIKHSYGRI